MYMYVRYPLKNTFMPPPHTHTPTRLSMILKEAGENKEDVGSKVISSYHFQSYPTVNAEDAPTNMGYEQFLEPQQLVAMNQVRRLLHDLEEVEMLYPNSREMGDAHPQYRRLRRKIDTLTLWLKAMDGLSKALSSMSSWLGVTEIGRAHV